MDGGTLSIALGHGRCEAWDAVVKEVVPQVADNLQVSIRLERPLTDLKRSLDGVVCIRPIGLECPSGVVNDGPDGGNEVVRQAYSRTKIVLHSVVVEGIEEQLAGHVERERR